MPKKRVFVDTNVIFECFRLGIWSQFTQRYQVETVQMCEMEALSGNSSKPGFIAVDPSVLRTGCHAIHHVTEQQVVELEMIYEGMDSLDDGEKHLFAYLLASHTTLSDVAVLCTADKGAIVRAHDRHDWLDWLESLEEVLTQGGLAQGKISSLKRQHTAKFLQEVRTKVRMRIIP